MGSGFLCWMLGFFRILYIFWLLYDSQMPSYQDPVKRKQDLADSGGILFLKFRLRFFGGLGGGLC